MAQKKFLDYDGLVELVSKIKEYVGDAGKLEFKGAVSTVSGLPTVSTQKVGWMYTIQNEGETTADFTDGAGLKIAANSEVAAVSVDVDGTPTMKWCLLGPVFDVSNKLTFGSIMPSHPADGDTFLYLGATTYKDVYNELTLEDGADIEGLGYYHRAAGTTDTWTLASETTADTTTYDYAEKTQEEEFVTGVIYVYDDTEGKWIPKSAGDTFIPITNGEIDALF